MRQVADRRRQRVGRRVHAVPLIGEAATQGARTPLYRTAYPRGHFDQHALLVPRRRSSTSGGGGHCSYGNLGGETSAIRVREPERRRLTSGGRPDPGRERRQPTATTSPG